jgi:hypothetical protein
MDITCQVAVFSALRVSVVENLFEDLFNVRAFPVQLQPRRWQRRNPAKPAPLG